MGARRALREGKDRERVLCEHDASERQLELALSYFEAYPKEIEEALEENAPSPEEWHGISPSVSPTPPA